MSRGIKIHNKTYLTVAERVNDFRDKHKDAYAIITDLVANGEWVVMQARIENAEGRTIATGFAEERRGSSQINKTSALENCETSAIGRALANLGFGGTEYASANEVQNAIHQQGGHSQGDDQGAVSPPAKKPPAHSKLKTELRAFVHDMEGCGDWDTWVGLREDKGTKRLIKEVREKLPQWWEGGPDMPEEFVPLHRRIEILEANLAESKAELIGAG